MRIKTVIILILLFITAASLRVHAGDSLEPDHVLLLNSYNQRMTWVKDIIRAVEDVLDPDNNNIVLHISNMDSKQFHSPEYFDSYKSYLKNKYMDSNFSLIFSSDNNAFDFLRKNRNNLFPDVPVVFCGVNNFKDEQIKGSDKFTGIAEVFSARRTVEMALKLHPETKKVFIVNDYLETGRAWQKDIHMTLADMKDEIKITYAKNLAMDELQATIASLDKNTIVLLGVYFADRDGKYFTYEKVGGMISGVSHVPVYCLLEFNMGKGVVGGEVISGYYQGQAMANIGRRILEGEDPNSIPVLLKGTNRVIFDYQQMKRFELTESSIPDGSVVINKPFSVFQEYKKQIITIMTMIIFLVITIVALILNILRRTRAEEALRVSHERFLTVLNSLDATIYVADMETYEILFINKYMIESFGKDMTGEICWDVFRGDSRPCPHCTNKQLIDKNKNPTGVCVWQGKNPITGKWYINYDRAIEWTDGRMVKLQIATDITDSKMMEEELRQAHKMESIGTLAGGIAHDFNNILSIIIGNAELALDDTPDWNPSHRNIKEIKTASLRAKDVVKQLLSFSRKMEQEQKPIDITNVIKESLSLIRSSVPSSIEIRDNTPESCDTILADSTQIHQVLINLCTNAAHAMSEDGGLLEVSLRKYVIEKRSNSIFKDMTPGNYLELIVADTGTGIEIETCEKIFDPYFTTKEVGKGTGMGLAVVHGIVKNHKGEIYVNSVPGKGTTFTILFPITAKPQEQITKPEAVKPTPSGGETILFVDDEEALVDMAKLILGRLGYTVQISTNPVEALALFEADPTLFDLVISDMTMPQMSGIKLSEKIKEIQNDIPIIICTGHSSLIDEERAKDIGISAFAMKPITMSEIEKLIRGVLDK